jgi:hypothetical protein
MVGGHCHVVLVVSPTPRAARRARAVIADHSPAAWVPVINRLGPGGETTVRDIERIIGKDVAVELPCCPALRDREDEGRLLKPPWTRWSRGIRRLVDVMER